MAMSLALEAKSEIETTEALVERLVERSVLTLFSLPDREHSLLIKRGGSWPEIVRMASEAYGYTPPRTRRFRPTPHDVSVMLHVWSWLTWMKRRSESDYRLVVAVAVSTPWHVLVARHSVNERTIRRWHDNAIRSLASWFGGDAKKIA